VMLRPRRLREHGGAVRLSLGVVLEVLLSASIAPILALIHCGLVADVLRGRDSGWRAQDREGVTVAWAEALRQHRWHAVAGVALGLVAYGISWQMLAWLTPAVAGMVLAGPLSKLVASRSAGLGLRRAGFLLTPEESRIPAISRSAEAVVPLYREAIRRTPDLAAVAADPALLERHLELTDRTPPRPIRTFDPVEAVAEKKIRVAQDVEEAVAIMTAEERGRVQAQRSLLLLLAARARSKGRWAGGVGPEQPTA
jgi:membrane glycosyltransferase